MVLGQSCLLPAVLDERGDPLVDPHGEIGISRPNQRRLRLNLEFRACARWLPADGVPNGASVELND